ncbi:uncharacterized protein C8R40DRAFT_1102146, partial [Lentinula edodes]|uniref:uncharacterized protein n=1 Tax=Lentinula edodes TaxID=5353 RepID=UPI001E8E62F8
MVLDNSFQDFVYIVSPRESKFYFVLRVGASTTATAWRVVDRRGAHRLTVIRGKRIDIMV